MKNEPVVERTAVALQFQERIVSPEGRVFDELVKRVAVRYSSSALRKAVQILEDAGVVEVERRWGPPGAGTTFSISWVGGFEPDSWAVEEYEEFVDAGGEQQLEARRPRRTLGRPIGQSKTVEEILAFAQKKGLRVSILIGE